MAIANPLTAGNQNAIKVYDVDFDTLLSYQIKLTADDCAVIVVDVDSVSFCDDYGTLNFELPCTPKGYRKLEVIETTGSAVLYTLNANVY